ncbi:phosphate signaling complex protein PhoU [Youngiibacter multivorans]|uniref:Phosphate-specific transport system accessory protein PhoU n=1 Tax=Youngiibacter multivorans TaxID=937251 RepID=A0ABS4G6P8_9CLOT|nr:phosphate signaling complex protein PhoU [Youngiibacter multivorans]MBP1920227.1 phosphate transport system protein [Youngiibacter multivorans]
MTKSIEVSINHMNNGLLRMGFLVETQMKRAIKALVLKDEKLAEFLIGEDREINELMRNIEDEAIKLIATQGPVASDLRYIFTVIKIVTDLERMGDHAKDIAIIALECKDNYTDMIDDELKEINDDVTKFINESLDSFVAKDRSHAIDLARTDDIIDEKSKRAIAKLYEVASGNNDLMKLAGQLQFVVKYLERNGDHATNICEWTNYIVTGQFKELN